MPSPAGHVIAAFAGGWLMAGPAEDADRQAPAGPAPDGRSQSDGKIGARLKRFTSRANLRRALLFGAVGLLPDLDLLAGVHSAYTHSIGGAVAVFLVSLAVTGWRRWPLAAGAGVAYLTHPVLDFLGEDTAAPFGVMLFWPLSSEYFHSDLDWFRAIDRRYWLAGFWSHNLRSIAVELAVLAPLAAVVILARGAGRNRAARRRRRER